MAELFEGGRIVDPILALVLVEAGAILLLVRLRRLPRAALGLLPTLAAGFFMILALRLALGNAGAAPVGAALFASLVAHCLDVARRLRGAREGDGRGRDGRGRDGTP